eukprot:TRINITY_DN7373_c0_g1_i1.p1 TRINITY_DN7373_c0_g1~~TRINITY_DN7373_c0_g1_i1.p1  ORF type:complete len:244 (+),score=22.40 TRINITY_DN7373_c0_g1_i1:123-854(+)
MSRREYINPEGLRQDGRRPKELRQLRVKLGVFPSADGSAYLEQGNTKVMCVIRGPSDSNTKSKGKKTEVNCEYTMASFSTVHRRNRTRSDRKSTEHGMRIAKTLETVILSDVYPRSKIDVMIQVLQADGGVLAAAINAASIAMMSAGVPMKGFMCACSAGVLDGTPVLDMNHDETLADGPELTLAYLPRTETMILNQLESRVHIDLYTELQEFAIDGCVTLQALLKKTVAEHTESLIPSFGPP